MSYELMMQTKWEAERRVRVEFDCRYGCFLKCIVCGRAPLSGSLPARCIRCDTVGSYREVGYTAPPEWIK